MKLQFNQNLPHQKSAWEAVVSLFEGQESCSSPFTMPQLNIPVQQGAENMMTMDYGNQAELGTANRLVLSEEELLDNLIRVQLKHGLKPAKTLDKDDLHYTVEMETGTGKTYVYLRSIYELHQAYGMSKFIIVVPSIAIKEGVKKSIEITREHLSNIYKETQVDAFIYDSGNLEQVLTFDGSFVRDAFGDVLKLFIVIISMGIFLFSKEYLLQQKFYRGEYFTLGLFGVLGMFVMVSAYNLITLYLGLEIMSLAIYAMVAMRKDNQFALESAMKYFVLGALATGMLLYGFSMLYGATGTIQFNEMAEVIASGNVDHVVLSFGVVFVVIGLAFKLGAVPFHMWVPDVYHGAPTAVTLYIGTAPKLAAFAIMYRLLVEGLPGLVEDWQSLIIMISILSLIVGAVITLVQDNLKRLLAYSGIGHVGFLLLGIIAANPDGYSAAMFYVIVYAITAVAGFGMITALARTGNEFDLIADFKGMNKRNPWLALMMLFVMFSMAGIPPFVGFYAKVVVIEEVVAAGFTWLAILAVVTAVISAFYYLKVVKVMYFDEPDDNTKIEPISNQLNWAVSFVSIALLLLGLMPSPLITLCYNSL